MPDANETDEQRDARREIAEGLITPADYERRSAIEAEQALAEAERDVERLQRELREAESGQAVVLDQDQRAEDGLTVLVSIGNSDDRLTQQGWAVFYAEVDRLVRSVADEVYGAWVSESTSRYQNASWAFRGGSRFNKPWLGRQGIREYLRAGLSDAAANYGQDSIAWLEGETEFLPGLA